MVKILFWRHNFSDATPIKLIFSSFQSTACINFIIIIWHGSIDFIYLSIIYCNDE
jgi:hypothetical protein